jgi:hypothetical protein
MALPWNKIRGRAGAGWRVAWTVVSYLAVIATAVLLTAPLARADDRPEATLPAAAGCTPLRPSGGH